jgi:hypothetical protein
MYCSQCGKSIDDDSLFCRFCGVEQQSRRTGITESTLEVTEEIQDTGIGNIATSTEVDPTEVRKNKPLLFLAFCAAILLLMIIVMQGTSQNTGQVSPATSSSLEALNEAQNSLDEAERRLADSTSEERQVGGWDYFTDDDKLRDATTYFASTTSTNTIHQDPPYDADTTMRLIIRKSPGDGTDVLLTISSGQMMCPSYEGCSGTVSFDGASPQRVSFNGTADNSSETVFVVGAKSFVQKIKKAKRLVVEKTIYEAGNPQFEFDVSDLKWEH